jgi:hypothetical protein
MALLAMLAGAIAPTLAHALGRALSLSASSEVCSSDGGRSSLGNSPARDQDGQALVKHATECCLVCAHNVTVPGGSPAWSAATISPADGVQRAIRDDRSLRALPACCDAQPRAPPRAI